MAKFISSSAFLIKKTKETACNISWLQFPEEPGSSPVLVSPTPTSKFIPRELSNLPGSGQPWVSLSAVEEP